MGFTGPEPLPADRPLSKIKTLAGVLQAIPISQRGTSLWSACSGAAEGILDRCSGMLNSTFPLSTDVFSLLV